MALIKFTKLNGGLIRNLPPELRNELIVFEDVISDGIMASLCVNDPFYDKERMDFLNHRDDVREKMYLVRCRREELVEKQDMTNIKTDEKIEFIKKYPQFKQLIESIIYRDENLNPVKVVPIDQYLAEN
ncbi:hypothetical protein [Methanobrevibacter sp.]|uniref:hypothetical protein n=1 Tax=Methanobrevibacter sp. TaxID=66852 RepID=UPI00386FD6C6